MNNPDSDQPSEYEKSMTDLGRVLSEFTAGHARLVQALQAKSDAQRPESIEFLANLQPADWIELVARAWGSARQWANAR